MENKENKKIPPFILTPSPIDTDEMLKILGLDLEESAPKPNAKITQEMSIGAIFEKNREIKKAKKAKKEKRF
jgi:hypothetical protein